MKNPLFLDWRDVTGVGEVTYTVQVSLTPSFGELLLEQDGLTSSSYTIAEPLSGEIGPETPYYWRVLASDSNGNRSNPSDPLGFVVGFSLSDVPRWALSVLTGMGGLLLMGMGLLVVRNRKGAGPAEDETEPEGTWSR